MAETRCDQCGKTFDLSWNGTKQCTSCKRWFCNTCGYRASQCPVCKTYTLRN